tara:strand:+ start:389 stop:595 length:207 start_codon:yes stop_codon:yes gene_type:complete
MESKKKKKPQTIADLYLRFEYPKKKWKGWEYYEGTKKQRDQEDKHNKYLKEKGIDKLKLHSKWNTRNV